MSEVSVAQSSTEYFGRTGCRWLYIPQPLSWCGPLATARPSSRPAESMWGCRGSRQLAQHWGMKAVMRAQVERWAAAVFTGWIRIGWIWFWDSPNHTTALPTSWVFMLEIWHKSYRLCLILRNLPKSHFPIRVDITLKEENQPCGD